MLILVTRFVWEKCGGLRNWGERKYFGIKVQPRTWDQTAVPWQYFLTKELISWYFAGQSHASPLDFSSPHPLKDNSSDWLSSPSDNSSTYPDTTHILKSHHQLCYLRGRELGHILHGWETLHYLDHRFWGCNMKGHLIGHWEYSFREEAWKWKMQSSVLTMYFPSSTPLYVIVRKEYSWCSSSSGKE